MEVEVAAPDTLDLESLRGGGPQPGETLQPEDEGGACGGGGAAAATAAAAAATQQADEGIVASLVSMGFSENGSKRAGAQRVYLLLVARSIEANHNSIRGLTCCTHPYSPRHQECWR